jgi:hypothetical protein
VSRIASPNKRTSGSTRFPLGHAIRWENGKPIAAGSFGLTPIRVAGTLRSWTLTASAWIGERAERISLFLVNVRGTRRRQERTLTLGHAMIVACVVLDSAGMKWLALGDKTDFSLARGYGRGGQRNYPCL